MRETTIEAVWRRGYGRAVRTAFLLTGNREDAEDLVQDAFVAALARWRPGSIEEYADAWIQAVVRNRAASLLRRRRVRREHEARRSPRIEVSPPQSDPELLGALGRLPPRQRSAVILRYCLDYSVDQTARVIGRRPGTVRALTAQGLARLRRELSPSEGSESHDHR